MFTSRFARRIAAAVLAAMLTVGGVVAVDEAQQDANTTEEAGGKTDSLHVEVSKGGFGVVQGATWS